jgi:hypothetical protein
MDNAESEWASEEFGLAELGDKRRARRLIKLAAAAARQPAGQVTAVYDEAAAREGTFRFLENEAVAPEAIALASHRACARRACGDDFAFVPVDGTSLKITDLQGQKGLGSVGARVRGARGLQVMTAIAVSKAGVPLGLCGQSYWARSEPSTPRGRNARRPVETKETRHWLSTLQQARKVFASEAPQTRPWFQLDRGGDAWPVLLDGLQRNDLFTVRAAQDRRLAASGEAERRYLWERLEQQPVLAIKPLQLHARSARKSAGGKPVPARAARTAIVELRAAQVALDLCVNGRKKRVDSPPLYALLASETAESAGDAEPIEWLLLTSHPIRTPHDAYLVVFGYTQRWRVEDFHKCWKSGVCKVEETQLRERANIQRWATVLAAVAMRVLRLTYLSRHSPGLPALEELSPAEVDAIILGSKSKDHKPGTMPPLGEIVPLLARIGGYTGPSSGGPPGPYVVARGLLKIEVLADALQMGVVAAVM